MLGAITIEKSNWSSHAVPPKGTNQCKKWLTAPGRPTGMLLRTGFYFLKMASNPHWTSGDAITKLDPSVATILIYFRKNMNFNQLQSC